MLELTKVKATVNFRDQTMGTFEAVFVDTDLLQESTEDKIAVAVNSVANRLCTLADTVLITGIYFIFFANAIFNGISTF